MKTLKKFNELFKNLTDNIDDWQNRDNHESQLTKLEKATRSHKFNCTGNCVKGDEIIFVKRIWEEITVGRFGKKVNAITGYEIIEAKIINDSYGKKQAQHTFTLLLEDGEKLLIKGRNLYAIGVWRKDRKDDREKALADKYKRASIAKRYKESFYYD